jgi:beta-glucanase (GH16 family)
VCPAAAGSTRRLRVLMREVRAYHGTPVRRSLPRRTALALLASFALAAGACLVDVDEGLLHRSDARVTDDASETSTAEASPSDDAARHGDADLPGWRLVFDDEFEGASLDSASWATCFPWGTTAGCNSTSMPNTWFSPDQAAVSGGLLHLRAEAKTTAVEDKTYTYASSMVTTAGFGGVGNYKRLFRYGRFETRMRVPSGRGVLSSFWLLAPEGRYPPEIDVISVRGQEPTLGNMTYQYVDGRGASQVSGGNQHDVDLSADFHVYALSWEADAIHWFIDGVEARPPFTQASDIVAEDLYVLLTLHVGTSSTGTPVELPREILVDYVRIWQR